MLVVTYKQCHWSDDSYIEQTAIFDTEQKFQEEFEKWKQERNPMIITGIWRW